MSKQEVDSSDVNTRLSELEARQKETEKKLKGYAGQIGVLKKQTGKSEPVPSPTEANTGQTEPPQAEKPHAIRSWEKVCPDCGGRNENYKQPNTFCKGCGVPLGTFKSKEEAKQKIAACWNCEGTEGKFVDSKQ